MHPHAVNPFALALLAVVVASAAVISTNPAPAQETAAPSPAEAIAALVPALAGTDAGRVEQAERDLERIALSAGRPGAEAERKAVAQAIIANLGPGVPSGARVWLISALQTIGKGEAIAPLQAILASDADPLLRESARRALEANPHVNAKRALREALPGSRGDLRIGIIRSLGVRRDILATGLLMDAAGEDDPEVKLAAIEALASIGEISAVQVIESSLTRLEGAPRARAERAYLRLGDSLVRNKERGPARRIYIRAMEMGPTARSAALLGFARAALQNEIPRILDALADPEPEVRGAALEAISVFPGGVMTEAILGRLDAGGSPAARSALLAALAARGEVGVPAVLVKAAEGEKDAGVRASAMRLLVRFGEQNESAATPMGSEVARVALDALRSEGDARAAAEEVLSRFPGELVTEAIVPALGKAGDEGSRAGLIRILGERRDPRAVPALSAAALDRAPAVRVAALRALGRAGDPGAVPVLLAGLRSEDAAEREAAEAALMRIRGPEAGQAIATALAAAAGPGGTPAQRSALLRILGARRDPSARPLLESALQEKDPALRLAAIEGLSRLEDLSAIPLLLEAAEKSAGDVQSASVRGALRLASSLGREKPADAEKVYLKALDLAKSDDDRRAALAGLAEVAGPDSLERITALLEKGPLQRAATRAALRAVERLPREREEAAKEIYRRILESDPDEDTARRAARRLQRLGVEVDLARRAGFVTHWWILGPFPDPDGSLWTKALSPEESVDLAAEVRHADSALRWKHYRTPDPRGLVALEEAGYPAESAVAYLHAEVAVKDGRDAILKIGSDDQVACWLNGKKVHVHEGDRGLAPDQDSVEVKLAPGTNRILLKVSNHGGGWGACLRITDRDGKPLEVTEKAP
jgi:HEAT repeat protein